MKKKTLGRKDKTSHIKAKNIVVLTTQDIFEFRLMVYNNINIIFIKFIYNNLLLFLWGFYYWNSYDFEILIPLT
jgi:hypothetical protein